MSEKSGCESCGKDKVSPQWKKDFPIEWEGDHDVSRREMVKLYAGIVSAGGRKLVGGMDRSPPS